MGEETSTKRKHYHTGQRRLSSACLHSQYLGPSVLQLSHIFVLCAVNSFVLFALTLLLGRTLWSLAVNTWTIEGWEIERHETVVRRARVLGFLEDPDGNKVFIEHQEFPWDIGIWANICQGMGSSNPFTWLWPFSRSPSVQSGLSFEHNEIDGTHRQSFLHIPTMLTAIHRPEQAMATTRPRQTIPSRTQASSRRRLHQILGHRRLQEAASCRYGPLH